MAKFNEDAIAAAINGAALENNTAAAPVVEKAIEVQKQTIVYDIPKEWIHAVKNKAHATVGGYMKAALREKLERDGLL